MDELGGIHETSLNPGAGWVDFNMNVVTGAISASAGVAAHVRSDAANAVLYTGTNSHVEELGPHGAGAGPRPT